MKLTAIHTIGRRSLIKKGDTTKPATDPLYYDQFNELSVAPGGTWDETDENEARRLIRSGAACRPENYQEKQNVPSVGAPPPAPPPEPQRDGPHSGATSAPDPNVVADRSMAGERVTAEQDARAAEQKNKTTDRMPPAQNK